MSHDKLFYYIFIVFVNLTPYIPLSFKGEEEEILERR
jgi:hypothetical protein